MSQFEKQLAVGKVGESEIAEWLKRKGHHILPVYEIEKGQYAGPAVYTSSGGNLIAPDMLCFGKGRTTWVEAKHKEAFTFYRIGQCWNTGIDIHHFEQYKQIDALCEWDVWLLFLHKGGQAKDSMPSPAGLFGGPLRRLKDSYCHMSDRHAKGMIYWRPQLAIGDGGHLIKLADYPLA